LTKPIFTVLLLAFAMNLLAQNPHGAAMKIDCAACHSSAGWDIDASFWQNFDPSKPQISKMTGMEVGFDTLRFHHGKTNFELKGRHAVVDCRACHETLVFSEANSDCISCHADMHQQTVGTDCARCHNSSNWLVDNTTDLHQENGFPLTGVHKALSCEECHVSASTLQFNRLGNDCISCHLKDFNAATDPNHKQSGFSTNCLECHDVFTPGWGTDKVNHDFFPLTKGHEISDCAKCHVGGNFSNTPTNCVACHQQDFEAATNPNHIQANFPNDCASCHTTDLDWMPAKYTQHDAEYFPICSGKHLGQWSQCTDCHINPSNFAEFSCTVCHINPETDDAHIGLGGYAYENSACLACHPTGDADGAFDHNTTNFPLTGAHLTTDCIACHAGGYAGTPTQCSACHTTDFNQTTNPNHIALNIPADCAMCHTTAPGWEPASFPIHNNYHALNGAHAVIANDCAACHNGNYNTTPNTCAGCHTPDYNATTNPNHAAAQFSTDCASCHSETAWAPATFDHDAQFFPIYSGKHQGEWSACTDCHTNPANYAEYSCTTCHANPQTDNDHNGIGGYTYSSPACLACHPTGDANDAFDHNTTGFPLTGAHLSTDCIQCHAGGYAGTPTQCSACHTTDFNQAVNPNHIALNIPTDCAMCHTTAPGWAPATFPIHNNYWVLNGAHTGASCAECHNGNYNNTPNTCVGCHLADYNSANNPNHASEGFPITCEDCHTTNAWDPSSFNHDQQYFPIYSGKHDGEWNQCVDCHTTPGNFTAFSCIDCHEHDNPSELANDHQGVNGYQYVSSACLNCHPNGN